MIHRLTARLELDLILMLSASTIRIFITMMIILAMEISVIAFIMEPQVALNTLATQVMIVLCYHKATPAGWQYIHGLVSLKDRLVSLDWCISSILFLSLLVLLL